MPTENYLLKLSPHLFWDVDINNIDAELHKSYIIGRVVSYGKIEDWKIIKEHIGMEEITRLAPAIRDLDPKSCSFLSLVTKIPLEEFRCYTLKQSLPPHWNF